MEAVLERIAADLLERRNLDADDATSYAHIGLSRAIAAGSESLVAAGVDEALLTVDNPVTGIRDFAKTRGISAAQAYAILSGGTLSGQADYDRRIKQGQRFARRERHRKMGIL
jgi:hypothetical protein